MAAEVSADLGLIHDEDQLRRMWQQTEDFGRKKEIRARMYKLREQRLKDFYTTGEVVTESSITRGKHMATNHADSLADQGFLSMKSKEIRDSESPTRDIHRRQAQNNYWNTVQESYSASDDGGRLIDTYERSMTGQGVSPDGRTQSKSAASEKQQHSSFVEETSDSSRQEEEQSRSSQAAVNAHTRTDDGEMFTSGSKQEEQKQSSSFTKSKTGNTTQYSSSKRESSSSSTSSRQAVSSSTMSTYQILPSGERVLISTTTSSAPKAVMGDNEVTNLRESSDHRDTTDHVTSFRTNNVSSDSRTESYKNIRNTENVNVNVSSNLSDSTQFITNEKIIDSSSLRDDHQEVASVDRAYKKDVSERDVSSRKETRSSDVTRTENETSNVVDQKIMTELHKLDSYLSTQNTTGTSTPVSPHSVTGDAANWTVVSSTDGEFVYKVDNDKQQSAPIERPGLIKQPSSLDLPKEVTEGQYVTTYQQSYQPKKISVEHSPTHDAFARSLRASPPPPSTRSSSKGSLDRSSPDRKFQKGGSPSRKSPDKERRVSVASSYTIEKPKDVKRKVSETMHDVKKESSVKSRRKFSSTQSKANAKTRASTPGTSPSASPTRMGRERSSSPSSGTESDSSQLTYSKKSSVSTIKRADVKKSTETVTSKNRTSPERSSPERSSPNRKSKSPSPTKTGILRKDSKSASAATVIIRSESPVKGKPKSPSISPERPPTTRGNSPEQKPEISTGTLTKKSSLKSSTNTVTDKTQKISSRQDVTISVDDLSEDTTKPLKPADQKTVVTLTRNVDDISTENTVYYDVQKPDKGKTTIEIDIKITPNEFPQPSDTLLFGSGNVNTKQTTAVSREDLMLSQTATVDNKFTDINVTEDFVRKEKDETRIVSPVHVPDLRDKSPEYSSEGSVSREIKAARSAGKQAAPSPDSSPERSAFTPIKGFRTSPELKDRIDVNIQEHSHPAGAPSPVSPKPVGPKDVSKKGSSPKPQSRGPSPTKSPTRSAPSVKGPVREKSSSISPYSSPERTPEKKPKTNERKAVSQRPAEKPADKPKQETYRPTRRSSIPRSETKNETLTKKISEKKIEIRQKPATRIPSFERKAPVQKVQTTRSDSQSSITRKTVTKTFKSTAVREVNASKTITKTPSTTKVKTTAIINLQKPTTKASPVQSRKPVSNTVVNITISPKKQPSVTPNKRPQPADVKKPAAQKSTVIKDRKVTKKEIVKEQKTIRKAPHKDEYDGSSDRSTSVSSPETVKPVDTITTVKHHDVADYKQHEVQQQSNIALTLICSSNISTKQETNDQDRAFTTRVTEVADLEDELPPEEFHVDDFEEDVSPVTSPTKFNRVEPQSKVSPSSKPVPNKKPGPGQSPSSFKKQPSAPSLKTPTAAKQSPNRVTKTPLITMKKPSFTQKASNESLSRTQSDRSITKTTVVKKETSKPDLINKNRTNVTTRKITTETGIAVKTTPSPKSATVKRPAVPQKKKPVEQKPDSSSSSSSEDEETDIQTESDAITHDQQQYINELEEMRLKEEQEYAAKVTATTNQEDSLLSVVIQHPKSSRESSPDYPSHSPFCTVSDDGGAHPRYADLISEPEDVEIFDVRDKANLYETATTKRFEQVTDLDEESETEDKLNVSVADRVSKFLATSQAQSTTQKEPVGPAPDSPKTVRKEVLKAKHMFETIAKNQAAPPAPNNKPVDILSRPSVFEGRRGVTAPKEKFDTFPRRKSKSPETVLRTNSTNDLKEETTVQSFTDVQLEERSTSEITRRKSISPDKEFPKDKGTTPQEKDIPKVTTDKTTERPKSPSPARDKLDRKKSPSPEKQLHPKRDSIKEAPAKKPTPDSKKPSISETKEQFTAKTSETSTKQNTQISSKRDFFERKAKVEQTTATKGRTPKKEPLAPSKPLKASPAPDFHAPSTDFIKNERKTSSSPRASPERKPSVPSQVKKSESPERKSSKVLIAKEKVVSESTSTVTRKVSSDKITERTVDRKSSVSPTKDRRDSTKASPERQLPKDSTKAKSPERTVRNEFVKEKSPEKSASPNRTTKKAASPERSAPTERKPSIKRSSPERKVSMTDKKESPERTVYIKKEGETVELNRAGRFGVTLRRTSSSSSTGAPRRSSTPGGGEEIEDIFQSELLEQMLEKAVGYEQRRRIRAQIRIVKKMQEDSESHATTTVTTTRKSTTTKSPIREPETKYSSKPADEKKPEVKKSFFDQKPASPQRPQSPTKAKVELSAPKQPVAEPSPVEESQPKRVPSPVKPKDHSPVRQETVRKSTRTETTVTSSTVRSQPREREPCPITSSYGVGPTDEHGRPLFGLKALRRSNTSKTLTADESEHQEEEVTTEVGEVCDARGRPLFGLRALQVSSPAPDTQEMPEVSSTQLRGLVERHEKNARVSTTSVESQPRQKPKAKLRDSFILQQDEEAVEETQTQQSSVTPQRAGVSLRSLIQKHEDISSTGGTSHREMESKSTVITSRSTVSSDGSVSLSRDVIKGELSSRNGEEPTGKVVHSKYSYHTPDAKNKTQGVSTSETTTKTFGGGRRGSGPKITEIEDVEERRSSITSEKSSRRYSGAKVVEYEDEEEEETVRRTEDSKARRTSQDYEDEVPGSGKFVSSAVRKFSGSKADEDERWQSKSSTVSSSKLVSTSSTTSSSVRKSNLNTSSTTDNKSKTVSSSATQKSLQEAYQEEEDERVSDDKKKPLIRGDSIRALQHKFQQATESAVNSTPQRGYPPAGLILRSTSFKSTDDSANMSSSLKQHSAVNDTKQRPNRTSPTGRRGSRGDSTTEELVQASSTKTISTSQSQSASNKTSFLDNTSRVTGVQDILERMRNADLVVESGDTNEDAEARALLNKFLGASVILQGMEQGMKSAAQTNGHGHHTSSLPASPTSAALVSRVEKQRMASTTTSSHQTEEDLENIWDEKQLRILLEACSDYEGRRKIRARLRNVMAEHKACADVVAVASDASGNSMLSQDCVESKQVSTKTEGSTITHSEVHTRTTSSSFSSHRMTKANSVTSPFAKFKQLERQNSAPSRAPSDTPIFKFTDPKLARSASTIKDRLLCWVQAQTKEYKNVQIENFSTSWSNGLAFCALIHHFCPEAFDYDQLTPEKRRHNFELAFRVAEEEADIAPLLDVEDMVMMRRPDWKCVFTYVQSVYRRFHSTPEAVRP